jgi:hypothetical protein
MLPVTAVLASLHAQLAVGTAGPEKAIDVCQQWKWSESGHRMPPRKERGRSAARTGAFIVLPAYHKKLSHHQFLIAAE